MCWQLWLLCYPVGMAQDLHPAEVCRHMSTYPSHTPSWLISWRKAFFESIPHHPDDKFQALLRCGLGIYSRLVFAFLRTRKLVLRVKLLK